VAEGDIHLSLSLPAAGGDGNGSATCTPPEHAGRRSGAGAGAGRQSSMKKGRLMDAAQQHMGEGEANFSVLTQAPPKLGVASIAGAASLLPEPPASASGSRPLSPRAASDQLNLQRELEARTKQLNGLFEQQLKSQYESMKSEASKLGRRHQGDVAQLQERLQNKMGGVAARVKQLDAEEDQWAASLREREELKALIIELDQLIVTQKEQQQALVEAIASGVEQVAALRAEVDAESEHAAAHQDKMASCEGRMAASERRKTDELQRLQGELERASEDLSMMQARLQAIKVSYAKEAAIKEGEVAELGEAFDELDVRNRTMRSYVGMVSGQVSQREADMRTQLGLLKNAIAFALYVDETLVIDLHDPDTTTLMELPWVVSTGVSYSKATLDRLLLDAETRGEPPICPQTKLPIEGAGCPNVALLSILSRFVFKQKVTNDVVHALRDFEAAGSESSPEGEQPIGVYVERMRANLLERMQSLYVEQQKNLELDLGAQLAWQCEAVGGQPAELASLEEELRLADEAAERARRQSMKEQGARLKELAAAREEAAAAEAEHAILVTERSTLLDANTALADKLRCEEEVLADNDDALAEHPTTVRLMRLRKKEVLALEAALTAQRVALAEAEAGCAAAEAEVRGRDGGGVASAIEELRLAHNIAERLETDLVQERALLKEKEKRLAAEAAALKKRVQTLETEAEIAEDVERERIKGLAEAAGRLVQGRLTAETLQRDADKLAKRLELKTEIHRTLQKEVAATRQRLEQAAAGVSTSSRQLVIAREECLELTQTGQAATEQANHLALEVARLQDARTAARAARESQAEGRAFAEKEVKRLRSMLVARGHDTSGAEEALLLQSMAEVKDFAGANLPIADMPRVRVLEALSESIGEASGDIRAMLGHKLRRMVVAAPLNDDGTRNEPEYEVLPTEEELRNEARREDAAFNDQTYAVSAKVEISKMQSFAPPGANMVLLELRVIGSQQAARNAAAAVEAAAAKAAARATLLPAAAREVAAPFVAAALAAAVDALVAAGIGDGSIMSSH
jgi:hypothetical protein